MSEAAQAQSKNVGLTNCSAQALQAEGETWKPPHASPSCPAASERGFANPMLKTENPTKPTDVPKRTASKQRLMLNVFRVEIQQQTRAKKIVKLVRVAISKKRLFFPLQQARKNAVSESAAISLSLLEHLTALSAVRCRNLEAPILFGRDLVNKKALVIRAPCKMWSCQSCGARKVKFWIARVINGINEIGGQWYFMTITAHRHWRGSARSLENIRKNWHKLLKRMRRQAQAKFAYVKIFEHHADDSFHLHLITNVTLPYTEKEQKDGKTEYTSQWLKDNAAQSGLGFMADYQPLRSPAGAAYYVAKYVTKTIGDDAEKWPKSIRRIQPSLGWPKLKDLTKENEVVWAYIPNAGAMSFQANKAIRDGLTLFGGEQSAKTTPIKLVKWYKKVRGEL